MTFDLAVSLYYATFDPAFLIVGEMHHGAWSPDCGRVEWEWERMDERTAVVWQRK